LTESVMEATDLPRSVASSAYSAVRFIGGAIAPPLAAELAIAFLPSTPYYFAAGSVAVATVILIIGSRKLLHINTSAEPALVEAEAIGLGESL
jgi:ACDE family multidrug resistance protein